MEDVLSLSHHGLASLLFPLCSTGAHHLSAEPTKVVTGVVFEAQGKDKGEGTPRCRLLRSGLPNLRAVVFSAVAHHVVAETVVVGNGTLDGSRDVVVVAQNSPLCGKRPQVPIERRAPTSTAVGQRGFHEYGVPLEVPEREDQGVGHRLGHRSQQPS